MNTHSEDFKPTSESAETLNNDVNQFAAGLQYWAQYLAERLLTGLPITDVEVDASYSYFLEELGLKEESDRPHIEFKKMLTLLGSYGKSVHFHKLEKVEGVNALMEGQVIEFIPQLTILYGANASGKSGYARLLKEGFYCRHQEEIQSNVRVNEHKEVNAMFTFIIDGEEKTFECADANSEPVFDQFAVFDEKCVPVHLDERNDFEFRPSGLNFFSDLTEVIRIVETKLEFDIKTKQSY